MPADRAGAARPRGAAGGERRGRIPGMVNVSERPAEAADRAVPGHWEGDLIAGRGRKSADRHPGRARPPGSRCWCRCPSGKAAEPRSRTPLTPVIAGLPDALRRSLTWDQGSEMASTRRSRSPRTARSTSATRTRPGSGAPTRTPTGCCASTSPRAPTCPATARSDLQAVADELNGRPRKTLGWKTPAEAMAALLDERQPDNQGNGGGLPPPLITGRAPRIVRGRPSGLKAAPHPLRGRPCGPP